MNAVIGLCHFCEVHGPCPIFCTHTLRDLKVDEIANDTEATANENCPGCSSIGKTTGMLSEDAESNANFLSTQTSILADVVSLVKQAAVRSLSCELTGSKDGNLVFFGDATRGHVLSYTFQIHDSQARGFFRLFSVVVLMKDKMFLLNIQPFLAEHLQKLSTELRTYSHDVYSAEQLKQSERAQRLNTGQTSANPPRSLIELTGQKNVFALIHSHFTWMLWMGARCLIENITIGTPAESPASGAEKNGFAIVQMDREEWLTKRLGIDDDSETGSGLRKCREILGIHFEAALYCTMVGIQIVLRGSQSKAFRVIKCLRKVIPESMHRLTQIDCSQYLSRDECRLLSIPSSVAVPQPSADVFRIDFVGDADESHVKWLGKLPTKYPDLLLKTLKAIDERLFTDLVLSKHVRVLVEKWKNNVLCLQKISSAQDLAKMKRILGVQPQDQPLIAYWSDALTN